MKFKSVLVFKMYVNTLTLRLATVIGFYLTFFKLKTIFKRKISMSPKFVNSFSSNYALKYILKKEVRTLFSTWKSFSLIKL